MDSVQDRSSTQSGTPDSWLDSLLHQASLTAPEQTLPLPDDDFTARVIVALPAQSTVGSLSRIFRSPPCCFPSALDCGVCLWTVLPGAQSAQHALAANSADGHTLLGMLGDLFRRSTLRALTKLFLGAAAGRHAAHLHSTFI